MPKLRYSLNNTTWLLLVIKVVLKVTVLFCSLSPSNIPCNVNSASVRKLGLATLNWALSFLFSISSFCVSYRLVHLRQWLDFCAGQVGESSGKDFSVKLFISPTYLYVCLLIALSCKYLLILVKRRERIALTTVNL